MFKRFEISSEIFFFRSSTFSKRSEQILDFHSSSFKFLIDDVISLWQHLQVFFNIHIHIKSNLRNDVVENVPLKQKLMHHKIFNCYQMSHAHTSSAENIIHIKINIDWQKGGNSWKMKICIVSIVTLYNTRYIQFQIHFYFLRVANRLVKIHSKY